MWPAGSVASACEILSCIELDNLTPFMYSQTILQECTLSKNNGTEFDSKHLDFYYYYFKCRHMGHILAFCFCSPLRDSGFAVWSNVSLY